MLQELLLACYTDNVKNPEMRDPELERLLCNYNTSLDQVQEVKDSINKTQQSEQNIAKRLWKTDTITQTLETKCGDQSAIKHEYSYQQAQYQTHENTRLTLTLQRLRSETNALLYRRFYEATLIRLEIQTLLDRILWELPCRAIPSTSKSEWEDQGTRKHDGLTLIRLLNTLFSTAPLWSLVLKEPTEEQEVGLFEKCVRAWILEVGGVLLDFSLPSERRCLLLQLLQTRSASWAIPLLQYSFHPTSKLPVADMEEYVVAIRMIFDHRLYESKDGTQTCPLPVWTEDDLLLALDQFGVAQTFCATIQEAFRQPLTKESVDALFKFADDLLDALNVGMRIMSNKGYKDLAKRLGQTTCHMAQRLIENIDESIRKESQHRIDKFISNVVLGYLQVEEKSMYNFLPILPFHGVSIDSLWTITLQLLKIDDLEKPDDFEDQLALPDMTHFLRFLEANQTQGIFMLGCLSNITTCILPTKDSTHSSRSLSGYLVTIIAHTLFIIAFVDTNLCDIYYKDVRDNFDPVCTCHPFVISLLLRWTYDNFSKMEGMTLYLFHSLPLDRWVPQTDDLVLLHKLLCKGPSASTQVSFGRYVIEHLNFGTISGSEDLTISKSQPWHNRTMPFLPYEIHEEIAFLLLDACQKYQPLPENEKSSNVLGIVATAMSAYMVNPDQLWTAATSTIIATEFIQWAWKVALQLKLYDCPIATRAADIEKAITPAFLKDALHHHHDTIGLHHALLTYVSFLLSSTSRHFLRFETSNGWLKLLLILRRGKPEAVIQVMSDIIPAFVYMHGDDFFNDESLGEFLRQMMEFKADPMLTRAALLRIPKRYHQSQFWSKQEITGIGMVLGSHAWQGHFIDSVGDLMDENGGGFSYLDLMLHSWLKTVFSRKEWMWSDQYVMAVDCIAKIAFSLGRYDLVRSMLMSEHMRLEQNRSQQLLSSPKLAALGVSIEIH
ncbi:hypothetical protein CLU79DRAFT_276347 [Phycomyces nitens]|nr:hypothetical protein CLU79DRAFT_276347 [Phycomyces nitens]